jgi:hypothetical protein
LEDGFVESTPSMQQHQIDAIPQTPQPNFKPKKSLSLCKRISKMISTIATMALAGLAAATPVTMQARAPPYSMSEGFKLVANVTGARDFTPSINGRFASDVHTGAGLARAVLYPDTQRVWYQNGTADDIKYRHADMVSDRGLYTAGFQIVYGSDNAAKHEITMNLGAGSMAVQLSDDKEPVSFVDPLEYSGAPGSFIACNETIFNVFRDEYYITLNWLTVNLIPQCAPLADPPAGSEISHEFAQEARCYEDVSAIAWNN